MERFVRFLSRRPAVAAVLVAAFFLVTMLFHDVVQNAVYAFAQWVGRGAREPLLRWNVVITVIGAPLTLACAVVLLLAVRRHPARRWLIAYWVVAISLVVVAYNTLFIMNSELVHFPQFAILAVLLFSITGRCGETVFWAGLLGAIDEAYQYWWLSREKPIYYDFNDVVLNMIGAGIGVLLVLTFAPRAVAEHPRRRPAISDSARGLLGALGRARPSAAAITCAVLIVVATFVAAWAGFLRVLPPANGDAPAAIVLRRCGPNPSFWFAATWGKTFHELSPFEGVVGAVFVLILFALPDSLVRPADPGSRRG